MSLASDDPRLTAYALGDLDDAERAEVERELETAPERKAEVEDVRRLAGQLGTALRAEPAPEFGEVVVAAAVEPRGSVARRQVVALLALAASLLLIVGVFAWPQVAGRREPLAGVAERPVPHSDSMHQSRDARSPKIDPEALDSLRDIPSEEQPPLIYPPAEVWEKMKGESTAPATSQPETPDLNPQGPGDSKPAWEATSEKNAYTVTIPNAGSGSPVQPIAPIPEKDRPFQTFGQPTNGDANPARMPSFAGGAMGKGGPPMTSGYHMQDDVRYVPPPGYLESSEQMDKGIGSNQFSASYGTPQAPEPVRTEPNRDEAPADRWDSDFGDPQRWSELTRSRRELGNDAEIDAALRQSPEVGPKYHVRDQLALELSNMRAALVEPEKNSLYRKQQLRLERAELDLLTAKEAELAKSLPETAGIRQKVLFEELAGFSRRILAAQAELMKAETELKELEGRADVAPEELTGKKAQIARLHDDIKIASSESERARRRIHALSEAAERRPEPNSEAYDTIVENPFRRVSDDPLSTFSIDVDTASYSNVRRFLQQHTLPPRSAVRIEELVNYFHYDYPQPEGEDPFAVHLEVAGCPWAPSHRLVRVALKGREIDPERRPPSNLVFLVDVSGSMAPDNKLPLVKQGLRMLTERMREDDRVAIVTYAGNSGVALASTGGEQKSTILEAIDALQSGGSTNGASGIELAYGMAVGHFIKNGTNRVILCTDGDFNVGVTDRGDLTKLIEQKAASGVFLSVLGFGMGNLKDGTLETLADKGNGVYAYIDGEREARKVLVEELSGTLVTIAKDVKLQLEFNPARVAGYRLLGYENRVLAHQDFNDDRKDAGDIGAGHTVTAFYEIVPVGGEGPVPGVDPLKYQQPAETTAVEKKDTENDTNVAPVSDELLTVKLRYKQPDGVTSKLLEAPLKDSGEDVSSATNEFRFAAAVVEFGLLLRDSAYRGTGSYEHVLAQAESSLGEDPEGHRREFMQLVQEARGPGRE